MKTKKLPTVYVVQASDALQHAAKLHEILKKFVAEQRIGGFQTRTPGDDLSKLAETAGDEDLIIVMLTEQLESDKEELETVLRALKRVKPDLKLSEIIVDNVAYDNEFIAFPIDLKPIRDRMDMVWADMEVSLRQMFPASKPGKQGGSWKKYIGYAAIAAAVILLIIFIPKLFSGGAPEVSFSYYVGDNTKPDTSTEFYPPVDVLFSGSTQYCCDSLYWTVGDSVYNDDAVLILKFIQPGKIKVTLTGSFNGKQDTYEKTLLIKQPPIAAFEIQNNGCTAPCQVSFNNTSTEAESFRWEFGNGNTSDTDHPTYVHYAAAGSYPVRLVAKNKDEVADDTTVIVRVMQYDKQPFADFTFSGNDQAAPCTVKFTNTSKNANYYEWNFRLLDPPNTPDRTIIARNPSVHFATNGTYSYEWTFQDRQPDPLYTPDRTIIARNPSVHFATNGTYEVTLRAWDSFPDSYYIDHQTKTITVGRRINDRIFIREEVEEVIGQPLSEENH